MRYNYYKIHNTCKQYEWNIGLYYDGGISLDGTKSLGQQIKMAYGPDRSSMKSYFWRTVVVKPEIVQTRKEKFYEALKNLFQKIL